MANLTHETYMARCIELARQAEGRTSPNPLVGAVVIDAKGKIVGEGYHQKAGEGHAEVFALEAAGDKAKGGTLYVSLEPCCHQGKTPPCSDAVIKSGVKHVVCGLQDPNPKVAGGGIRALRDAGIEVTVGVLQHSCHELNRAWLKWITSSKTPWTILKVAATLDGRIADREGRSRWITGEEARRYVHQMRNRVDCVMIGGKTACTDNAELTVRDVPGGRNPIRAILDPTLQLDVDSKLAKNPDGLTWVFASEEGIKKNAGNYGKNVRLIAAPLNEQKKLKLDWVLSFLGSENVLSVFCEGGGKLADAMLPLIDEFHWFVAPKIMNDAEAIPALGGNNVSDISRIKALKVQDIMRLGDDVLVRLTR